MDLVAGFRCPKITVANFFRQSEIIVEVDKVFPKIVLNKAEIRPPVSVEKDFQAEFTAVFHTRYLR